MKRHQNLSRNASPEWRRKRRPPQPLSPQCPLEGGVTERDDKFILILFSSVSLPLAHCVDFNSHVKSQAKVTPDTCTSSHPSSPLEEVVGDSSSSSSSASSVCLSLLFALPQKSFLHWSFRQEQAALRFMA